MELRTLRAFVEVVRQGGFTQAAKIVFATQSTVSKAVKQLEDEIGVPLLDRIGHRSKLTAAGEIVYRRAPPPPPPPGPPPPPPPAPPPPPTPPPPPPLPPLAA